LNKEVAIPVRIEPLEDGWHLAICDVIQGCHAEGETIPEVLENIEDVARIILELQREKGLPLDPLFDGVPPDAVIRAKLVEDLDRA
jgi:predicted RNase H-like HicB family nuclease